MHSAMLLGLALSLGYIFLCPFTKVEESFNVQAVHDILTFVFGHDASNYFENRLLQSVSSLEDFEKFYLQFDHQSFPGVVPRSFFGAWITSMFSWPALVLLSYFPNSTGLMSKLANGLNSLSLPYTDLLVSSLGSISVNQGCLTLVLVRCFLCISVWGSLTFLASALGTRFGRDAQKWFGIVCLSQFHLSFYSGRFLPNTYAIVLTSIALGYWLKGEWRPCVNYLAFCTIVFRCDTVILSGAIALVLLGTGQTNLPHLFIEGFAAGIVALMATIPLDSLMWLKPSWPEGSVLFFNSVLNKSSEWGIMPWHWYLTSAVPKMLLFSAPLAFLGPFQSADRLFVAVKSVFETGSKASAKTPRKRSREKLASSMSKRASDEVKNISRFIGKVFDTDVASHLFFPTLFYVGLYSFLPHKEVRFLFQVLPFFNCLAAISLSKIARASSQPSIVEEKKSDNRDKNSTGAKWVRLFSKALLSVSVIGLVGSWIIAQTFFLVSSMNYPGAHALLRLQEYHKTRTDLGPETYQAHYCVYAAMSGISRFVEHGTPAIKYSKREDPFYLENELCQSKEFEYLIMEIEDYETRDACRTSYKPIGTEHGEPRMIFDIRNPRIETRPVLHILKRKAESEGSSAPAPSHSSTIT